MLVKVKDIVAIMEYFFPNYLAEAWDNVGLQLGSLDKDVKRVIVALDVDEEILEQAINQNGDLIISHHPLFFKAVKSINFALPQGKMIRKLIQRDISVYSAHTNLDAAARGLNQHLAEYLGLQNIQPLGEDKKEALLKLVVYVPATHLNEVRKAINEAGAGHTGEYSDCSFCSLGTGNFRPGEGSHPFLGKKGVIEEVDEYRLETVVYEHELAGIIKVMKEVHPYEEVAYDVYHLENEGRVFSLGRKGYLKKEMTLGEYADEVKKRLGLKSLRVVGNMTDTIRTVAVISGAGASVMNRAVDRKIDLLISGDIKYHEAKEAQTSGLAVIDAGHQGTEEIVTAYLCNLLREESRIRGVDIEFIAAYSEACFQDI